MSAIPRARLLRTVAALLTVLDRPADDGSILALLPADALAVDRARALLAKSAPKREPAPLTTFTSVPAEWYGVELFDWSGALRSRGGVSLPGAKGRPCKHFAWAHGAGLVKVYVPNSALVRKLRTMTAEVWSVRERQGKFWNRTHYLAPAAAVDAARAALGLPASEPAPVTMDMSVDQPALAAA